MLWLRSVDQTCASGQCAQSSIWSLTDEDIPPSDAPAVPSSGMQGGPMTRGRRRQLNLEVSSILSDPFYTFENRLLPNDIILIRNIREGHEELRGSGGGDDD
jgi:hypothetical protein